MDQQRTSTELLSHDFATSASKLKAQQFLGIIFQYKPVISIFNKNHKAENVVYLFSDSHSTKPSKLSSRTYKLYSTL